MNSAKPTRRVNFCSKCLFEWYVLTITLSLLLTLFCLKIEQGDFPLNANHLLHLPLRHLVDRWANMPSLNSNVAVLRQSQRFFCVLVHSSDQCHLVGRHSSCSVQPECFWEWQCIVGERLWLHQGLGIESSMLFLSLGITEISNTKSFQCTNDVQCKSLRQILFISLFLTVLQDDLSKPLVQENLDCSSGVLFPFYDPDTHMLYIVGKVCLPLKHKCRRYTFSFF